jgi:hypothetical protein
LQTRTKKTSNKRENMESWPQTSNEKGHGHLDFLTKVSTQSDKGEENNKLTLGQQ